MRLANLAILFALTTALPSSVFAVGANWPTVDIPRFWILGEGSSHFSVDGTYFYTKENYDESGNPTQPSTMEHVRYGNARLHAGLGFAPHISLFAQADFRALFALNSRGSNVSDDENYGPGDAFVGMRWLLYRSKASDRVYPTEWAPESVAVIAEGTWNFPLYDRAKPGAPPLGDQSNDFTGMGRAVWYANEWLALSGGLGYTHRTGGYAAAIPWNLRSDINLLQNKKLRFWLDFQAIERAGTATSVFNPSQPDPIPGGSLLFKSDAPTLRIATLGAGHILSKEFEITAAAHFTAAGVNAAKGVGATLGLAWRPYQIPEMKYEEYRRVQIQRLQEEPIRYRKRNVLRYGLSATVLRVSNKGNFFRVAYGSLHGVKKGDTFHVLPPDDFSGKERKTIAVATVAAVRPNDSFLRVQQKITPDTKISAGQEARRVIFEE